MIPSTLSIDHQNTLPRDYRIGFCDLGVVPGNQSDAFTSEVLSEWRKDLFRRLRNHLKRVCKQTHNDPEVEQARFSSLVLAGVSFSSCGCVLGEEAVPCRSKEDTWNCHGAAEGSSLGLAIQKCFQGICLSEFKWSRGDEEGDSSGLLRRGLFRVSCPSLACLLTNRQTKKTKAILPRIHFSHQLHFSNLPAHDIQLIIVFLLFQKYFTKGVMIGAVKG